MADWYGNRYKEKYEYIRVSWDDWTEHEAYDYITSGSVEMSTDSALKVTGRFGFEGMTIPNTSDLMRVYYSFADVNGDSERVPIATFAVSYANISYDDTITGIKAKGTLDGRSLLSVLEDVKYGQPYTVRRNTNMIYKAQELIKGLGVPVEFTPSIRVMSADHTFNADDTYLDMVNWLLNTAGYAEAYPDAYGVIQLRPYAEVELTGAALTIMNDNKSIMYPTIEESNNIASIPNVVKLLYNTDEACIRAEARNVAGSRASLDARGGRELTLFEDIGELDETSSKLTALMDLAETMLRKESCDVEYVTLSHAYIPIYIYQSIRIMYADMIWTGNADTISISLSPSTKTQLKIRRVLYENIEVTKSGAIIRGS